MEHRRKLIHVTKMPIRWGDMDAYGHVNNTVYFRYMEQARSSGSRTCRSSSGRGRRAGDHQCQLHFSGAETYPGMVEVRTYVGAIGRSSFQTYVEMRIEGDDRIYAEGAAKVVWMNTQNGKSVPVPDHIRAALEAE
jgi:acyl-CoA thioester hydrolase